MRIVLICILFLFIPLFSDAVDVDQYLGKIDIFEINDRKVGISDLNDEKDLIYAEKHIDNLKKALNSTDDYIQRSKLTDKLKKNVLDLIIVKFRIYSTDIAKIRQAITEFRKETEIIDYHILDSLVSRVEKLNFSKEVSEAVTEFLIEEWKKFKKQKTDYQTYHIFHNIHKMVSRVENIDETEFFMTMNQKYFTHFSLIKQDIDLLIDNIYMNENTENKKVHDFVINGIFDTVKPYKNKSKIIRYIINYSLKFSNYAENKELIEKIRDYLSEEEYEKFTVQNNFLHGNPGEYLQLLIEKFNENPAFIKAVSIIEMSKLLKINDNNTEIISENLSKIDKLKVSDTASYILDNTEKPEIIVKTFDYLTEIKDYQLEKLLKNYHNRFDLLVTKLMRGNILFTGNMRSLFELFILKDKEEIAFTYIKGIKKYHYLKSIIEILVKYRKIERCRKKIEELLENTDTVSILRLSREFKNEKEIYKIILKEYIIKERSEEKIIELFREIIEIEYIHLYEIIENERFSFFFESEFTEKLIKSTIDTRIYKDLGILILQNSQLMNNSQRINNCLKILHKAEMFLESKNIIRDLINKNMELENSVYSELTMDFIKLKEFRQGITYYRKCKKINELTSLINQLFIMFRMKDKISAQLTINQILGMKLSDDEKLRAYKNIYNNYYPLLTENQKSEIMKILEEDDENLKIVISRELNQLIINGKSDEFREYIDRSKKMISNSELDLIISHLNTSKDEKILKFIEDHLRKLGEIRKSDEFFKKIISDYIKYYSDINGSGVIELIRDKIDETAKLVRDKPGFYEYVSIVLEKYGYNKESLSFLEKIMAIDEKRIPELHVKFLEDTKIINKLLKNKKYSSEVLVSLLLHKCKNDEFSEAVSLLNKNLSKFDEKMRILFFLYGKFSQNNKSLIFIDELFRLYKDRYENNTDLEISLRLEFVSRMAVYGFAERIFDLQYISIIFNKSEYKMYSETLRKLISYPESYKLISRLNLFDAEEKDLNKFFGDNTVEIRLLRKLLNQNNIETFRIDDLERLIFRENDADLIFSTGIYFIENTLDINRKINVFRKILPLIKISEKTDKKIEEYLNRANGKGFMNPLLKFLYYNNKGDSSLTEFYSEEILKYLPSDSGILKLKDN